MIIPAGQALFSRLFAGDKFVGGKAGLALVHSIKNVFRGNRYGEPSVRRTDKVDLPYYESNRYVGDEIEREHEGLGG